MGIPYKVTGITPPKGSWKCYLFNNESVVILFPLNKHPNWFHRKMTYLILGFVWVKL